MLNLPDKIPVTARAQPLSDPEDPAPSIPLCADYEQLGIDRLEEQETVTPSLIDNWIDA